MFLWVCWFSGDSGDDEWCSYVIAPTRGKAKAMFFGAFDCGWNDYIFVRARKIKPADGFAAKVCDMQCPELDALGVRYLTEEEIDMLEETPE